MYQQVGVKVCRLVTEKGCGLVYPGIVGRRLDGRITRSRQRLGMAHIATQRLECRLPIVDNCLSRTSRYAIDVLCRRLQKAHEVRELDYVTRNLRPGYREIRRVFRNRIEQQVVGGSFEAFWMDEFPRSFWNCSFVIPISTL